MQNKQQITFLLIFFSKNSAVITKNTRNFRATFSKGIKKPEPKSFYKTIESSIIKAMLNPK